MLPFPLPAPNLNGDYKGSCVACLKGTDTGMGFAGEPEWVIAGLIVLGIPECEASEMVRGATGCKPGEVPDHDIALAFRVCAGCCAATGTSMAVGLVADDALPTYSPR